MKAALFLPTLALACSATDVRAPAGEGGAGLVSPEGGYRPAPIDCGGIEQAAKAYDLKLLLLVDRSTSMAGAKWQAASDGIVAFAEDERSAGTEVALSFFPLDPAPTTPCDQHAYQTPKLSFGALPDHGPAVASTLQGESASGFGSPIYPALGGAVLAAIDEAKTSESARGAVVLVTDGEPDGPADDCAGVDPESPDEIAALAAAGFQLGVTTHVVGLPGINPSTGNKIAKAGGTSAAIVIGATGAADAFYEALLAVRGDAIDCAFPVPDEVDSGDIDYFNVNVNLTRGGGEKEGLYFDPACETGHWKYNDVTPPTQILLCPALCTELRTDFDASIQFSLGCATQRVK